MKMIDVFTVFLLGILLLPAFAAAQDPVGQKPHPDQKKDNEFQRTQVHAIVLPGGWSGISSYLDPDDPALAQLLEAIADKLVILSDFQGNFYPPEVKDSLPEWDLKHGYYIKMNGPDTLEITGSMPESRQLFLQEGWNLVPVLSEFPVNVSDYFFGNAGKVEIITEVAGLKVWWPEKSITTLQQLLPGRAYLVKANAPLTLFQDFACGDSLTDLRDGRRYATAEIGDQCWMTENLNTGIMIDISSDQTNNDTLEKYCYENLEAWCQLYGALYQWDEFMQYSVAEGVRGICPEGWHVSTYSDWMTMIDNLGGSDNAGTAMKSTRTEPDPHPRWNAPNAWASNESGFSALPGGYADWQTFYDLGAIGIWWTSAEYPGDVAYAIDLNNYSRWYTMALQSKNKACAVRCVRGDPWVTLPVVTTAQVSAITAHAAISGGKVWDDGNAEVTARGVIWNTSGNPDLSNHDGMTTNGTGEGDFISSLVELQDETIYYVRAYATNSIGTSYGEAVMFVTLADDFTCGTSTMSDVDGNVYATVAAGNLCWMAENLKTTHYSDGTPVEYPGDDNSAWYYNTAGAYAWYENNPSWKDLYGAIYNWPAVNSSHGLCPEGWHVAGHDEWTSLEQAVCTILGHSDCEVKFPYDYTTGGWRGTDEGDALKSCRQVNSPLGGNCNTTDHPRWNEHTTHFGTDAIGFSALPGGVRLPNGGYNGLGYYGYFWTATEAPADQPWSRGLQFSGGSVFRGNGDVPGYGFSVRCVRDF